MEHVRDCAGWFGMVGEAIGLGRNKKNEAVKTKC